MPPASRSAARFVQGAHLSKASAMDFSLVDIGLNLAHDSFDADREAVVAAAIDAGVRHMVVTGSSLEFAPRDRDCSRGPRDVPRDRGRAPTPRA